MLFPAEGQSKLLKLAGGGTSTCEKNALGMELLGIAMTPRRPEQ
jgi:hypothetical protein